MIFAYGGFIVHIPIGLQSGIGDSNHCSVGTCRDIGHSHQDLDHVAGHVPR